MSDYIEREKLKELLRKRRDWLEEHICDEYSEAYRDSCDTDIDLVDKIPSADVVPVKHTNPYVARNYRMSDRQMYIKQWFFIFLIVWAIIYLAGNHYETK